jgi:hypothetical protein
MAKKQTATTKDMGDLAQVLIVTMRELFTPAVEAVSATANQGITTAEDVGHKAPVHNQLRWFLTTACQNIHDTLRAVGRTFPDGRPNYSLKDRRDYSQSSFIKLVSKYGDDQEAIVTDPTYDRITKWMEANYKSYDLFVMLEEVFQTLHLDVCGEPWKPYERKPNTAMAGAINEAAKKVALERLAKAQALVQAN